MKKQIIIIIAVLFIIPGVVKAQNNVKYFEDEKAIRQIIKNLYDAWEAGDGTKWADQFADDVDFTVWNGIQFTGREENVKGHQMIFDTFYKDTEVKAEIRKIRFITENVAAVQIRADLYRNGKVVENTPTVLPLMILKKENGKWRIVVFQNTPVINEGELVVGRKINKEKN